MVLQGNGTADNSLIAGVGLTARDLFGRIYQNYDGTERLCKRCGVEALGSEMIVKLSYYERWIVAFANILLRKEIITPTEFALKMREVEGRWPTE